MTSSLRRCLLSAPLCAAAAVALAVAPSGAPAAPAPKPNVIVIVADDLGYGEPGCYGGREIPTPHLDALARAGVRFTQGYVTASVCGPSRAGLLTGRHQTRFGFEHNPLSAMNADPRVGLPSEIPTFGSILQDAGYVTGAVGKWHLGGTAKFHPLRRGFEEFFGFLHEGHFYVPPPWDGVSTLLRRVTLPGGGRGRSPEGRLMFHTVTGVNEDPYDADNPLLRGGTPIGEREHLTDAFTREAVDFIGRHRSRPFFLYLAYNAVHSPLQGADAYLARFAAIPDIHRRIFAAMLAHLDDGIGRVLRKLRTEGLEENTLVFFVGDNGGPTSELTSSNGPLRGGKGSMYEGGLRVPFLAQWKGRLPAGRTFEHPVLSLDLLATAVALAGVADPAVRSSLDGVDLLPCLTGVRSDPPHTTLYWRRPPQAALRHGPWKLVKPSARGGFELYDLSTDLAESRNLAADQPERVRELAALWTAWDRRNVAPLFGSPRRGPGGVWIYPPDSAPAR